MARIFLWIDFLSHTIYFTKLVSILGSFDVVQLQEEKPVLNKEEQKQEKEKKKEEFTMIGEIACFIMVNF